MEGLLLTGPTPCSIFYDCLLNLLLFGLGGVVKTGEEECNLMNE